MPGGGRFTALGLVQGILQEDRVNEYLVLVNKEETSLRSFANAEQRVIGVQNRFGVRAQTQIMLPSLLRREKIDVVHFAKNLGAFFLPCKALVTIYDLTILSYPQFFPAVDVAYWRTLQALFLKTVDQIVVLSEHTKRDLLRYYRLPAEKIGVVYSACDPMFQPLPAHDVEQARMRYHLPHEYILSVGNISPKKNFETVVRALRYLKDVYHFPHRLVIVGKEYWQGGQRPLQLLIDELGLKEDVLLLGPVVGRDLVALYNGATLFAFPSLDEGFGIVLVEAMASGAPVIASGTSAIPEVVGNAGILVNEPTDDVELAKAMALVITDVGLRNSLVQLGYERSRQFSWRRAGSAYLELYRRLLIGRTCNE